MPDKKAGSLVVAPSAWAAERLSDIEPENHDLGRHRSGCRIRRRRGFGNRREARFHRPTVPPQPSAILMVVNVIEICAGHCHRQQERLHFIPPCQSRRRWRSSCRSTAAGRERGRIPEPRSACVSWAGAGMGQRIRQESTPTRAGMLCKNARDDIPLLNLRPTVLLD